MSKLKSKLLPLFEEARRRHMFRVVILYVLVGLAALEGAGNLGSALNFPGWTDTLVALLVLAGFPVAILVGWFFDFTASGFVRTDPTITTVQPRPIRSETPSRGGAPSTGAYPAFDRPADPKSIAVLPFVDMSPDGSQEYFGDGIAEEIINSLTRIEDLRVVARTSSFAFKGRDAQAQEIGAQLGVGCLLEGSVRTVGDQVRITAQLIDCEHGYHLWSERYDREMKDVFAIQDEVARSVYGEAIGDVLRDYKLDDEEKRFLSGLRAELQLAEEVAQTIYEEGARKAHSRFVSTTTSGESVVLASRTGRVELKGSSTEGLDDAIQQAIDRVVDILPQLESAKLADARVMVSEGGIKEWRVVLQGWLGNPAGQGPRHGQD